MVYTCFLAQEIEWIEFLLCVFIIRAEDQSVTVIKSDNGLSVRLLGCTDVEAIDIVLT